MTSTNVIPAFGLCKPFASPPRYVEATKPVETFFKRPTSLKRYKVIDAVLLGAIMVGDEVRHFQMEADGVIYMVPPAWLPPYPLERVTDAMRSNEERELLDIVRGGPVRGGYHPDVLKLMAEVAADMGIGGAA